jgi:hypothetical protein
MLQIQILLAAPMSDVNEMLLSSNELGQIPFKDKT